MACCPISNFLNSLPLNGWTGSENGILTLMLDLANPFCLDQHTCERKKVQLPTRLRIVAAWNNCITMRYKLFKCSVGKRWTRLEMCNFTSFQTHIIFDCKATLANQKNQGMVEYFCCLSYTHFKSWKLEECNCVHTDSLHHLGCFRK